MLNKNAIIIIKFEKIILFNIGSFILSFPIFKLKKYIINKFIKNKIIEYKFLLKLIR